MSDKTVRQLAEVVKIPLDKLLEQLKEAGLSASAPDDVINEDEKMQLLAHLRKRHGKAEGVDESTPTRVTLKRRKVSELKQASGPGSATKTISVEVRKKKTYIKRTEVAETGQQRELELAKKALEEQQKQIEREAELRRKQPAQPEAVPGAEAEHIAAETAKVEKTAAPKVAITEPEFTLETEVEPQAVVVAEPEVEPEAEFEIEFETLKVKEDKKTKLEKSSKTKEAEEVKKKQDEKERRLEESIKRNADKVRQQAAVKQETLHRKKQDEGARTGGKDARKGKKKGKQAERGSAAQVDSRHQFEMPVTPIVKEVAIPEHIIVSDLAQKMSVKAAEVIKQLMKLGIMATINQSIDQETAVILVEEMGHKVIMQSDDDLEQEMLAEVTGGRPSRGRHARADCHHHGSCRSRQDVAAGLHS